MAREYLCSPRELEARWSSEELTKLQAFQLVQAEYAEKARNNS